MYLALFSTLFDHTPTVFAYAMSSLKSWNAASAALLPAMAAARPGAPWSRRPSSCSITAPTISRSSLSSAFLAVRR